jgi:hypothetical protein
MMEWNEFGRKHLWPNEVKFWHFLGRTDENHKKPVYTTGVTAKIWTEHLWNTHLKHYFQTSLLGNKIVLCKEM